MGRHLWRLLKPLSAQDAALQRSIPLWTGHIAGRHRLARQVHRQAARLLMRDTDSARHEVGLHAWDHHGWQANTTLGPSRADSSDPARGGCAQPDPGARSGLLRRRRLASRPLTTQAKEQFGFRYNSDCRGSGLFRPLLQDGRPGTPQIPVNLPTFDEVVGHQVTVDGFNRFLLDQLATPPAQGPRLHHPRRSGRDRDGGSVRCPARRSQGARHPLRAARGSVTIRPDHAADR